LTNFASLFPREQRAAVKAGMVALTDEGEAPWKNDTPDATARVSRELTVSELDNVHGGWASSEHGAMPVTGAGKASLSDITISKNLDNPSLDW
jgi:hypothetical protein